MTWNDLGKRPGPQPKRAKGRQPCTFEGCDNPNHAHGLCQTHAMQQRRGVPLRAIRPPRPVAEEGFRWCGSCKQFRDEDEFSWDTTRDQPKRTCRPCIAVRQKEYVGRNRERVNLQRRLSRRGITEEEFNAIWARQGGGCGICGRTDRPLDIDRCHRGGHVRGLLCSPCNRALGFIDDDIDLLRAAIAYLESSRDQMR